MGNGNIVFTEIDKMILESYKTAMAGMSAYLGTGYELVVHSLEDLEHSVVAIYNGNRSGRRIGSPVTDLALQMLARIEENGTKDFICYQNHTRTGTPLRSSTILIRGENNRVIGLICINFYLDTPVCQLLDGWNSSESVYAATPMETLAEEASDLISTILADIQQSVECDESITPSNRNKQIIISLYERGIFNLKNSVQQVAELLGLSKNTVYLHLRNMERR